MQDPADLFVGREDELKLFREMLAGESSTRILNIHGEAGIGKTHLLKQMQQLCDNEFTDKVVVANEIIDFYDIESRSRNGVLIQITRNLGLTHTESEGKFWEVYSEFIKKKANNEKMFVFFFDSYEQLQNQEAEWIEAQLFQRFSNSIKFIVSGRNPLKEVDRLKLVVEEKELFPLNFFEVKQFWEKVFNTEHIKQLIEHEEVKKFFSNRRLIHPESIYTCLYKYSHGHPIWVALLAEYVNYVINLKPKDFRNWLHRIKKLIEEHDSFIKKPFSDTLEYVTESMLSDFICSPNLKENVVKLVMAVAHHRMTPELLMSINFDDSINDSDSIKINAKNLITDLGSCSLCKSFNGGIILHEKIRHLILNWLNKAYSGNRDFHRSIAKDVIAYYERKFLASNEASEECEKIYTVEFLEYAFIADTKDGLSRFYNIFNNNLDNEMFSYCELFLRKAEKFYDEFLRNDIPYFSDLLEVLRLSIDIKKANKPLEKILRKIQTILEKNRYNTDWKASLTYAYIWKLKADVEHQAEKFSENKISLQESRRALERRGKKNIVHILHLSDIHLGTKSEAKQYRTSLSLDLEQELKIDTLDYLVISGDIATLSVKDEYDAALDFIEGLKKNFKLTPDRIVIVPGNHDLNWRFARKAYSSLFQNLFSHPPKEQEYAKRFLHFAEFYQQVKGKEYPEDYDKQARIYYSPDDCLLFLALNSSWQIDCYNRGRAGIHKNAFANALDQLADKRYNNWLKIAVWHHPVTGREMMDDAFLEQLSVRGFEICMHGHIHQAKGSFYRYDLERGLHIIGAGTFGAPAQELIPGIPLQYNLLILDRQKNAITIETRKKENRDGAWQGDPRWGDKNHPSTQYSIELKQKW